MNKLFLNREDKYFTEVEYGIIIIFSLTPIFLHFPYRINIFLSWEGAYRLYLGQVPYRDFGLPMGFGYWIIPAIFFKIFGPYLITLVKAQAFINIISALAFRSILKVLSVNPPIRFLSILLFLISFSFVNFWPWYNHTVIVFELIGIALVLQYIFKQGNKYRIIYLFSAAFFLFISLFTKQDAGTFAFLIAFVLIITHCIYEKKLTPLILFLVFYLIIGVCIIAPFTPYRIGYWINYGQAPHYDRLSVYDIADVFFGKSEWIKFYILLISIILLAKLKDGKQCLQDKTFVLYSLLVLGIIAEAAVFQVTSYIPEYNNIFFHSFAISYIFSFSTLTTKINFRKWGPLASTCILLILWWSSRPWQYTNRIIERYFPKIEQVDTSEVSIRSFMRPATSIDSNESTEFVPSTWRYTKWKVFKDISMPQGTIEGIQRLLSMPLVKNDGPKLKVLNMTELTPLAKLIGYIPETGPDVPLWYHKNVAMYPKEIEEYETKIRSNYYDLVLFEDIPALNNFYPFEIKDSLAKYYKQVDRFVGPRREDYSNIQIYVKKYDP